VLQHGTPEQVAAMFAVQDLRRQYRQGVADLIAGHEPGHAGRRPAAVREEDPVADAWEIRFGQVGTPRGAAVNIRYLHAWLPRVAERGDVDVSRFAAGLRSMSAELTRVLGERPDDQWLGRCPATIIDDGRGACGTGLWQDPHASVVECPRCRSAWGPRPVHLVHLASEIRRVWPLDRRRRYNAEEIDALRPISCPGCVQPVAVKWQEVTAVADRGRWWRPVRAVCGTDGCEQAGAIL
jgi:DNA-directed RNA polymerase subunit RPC12/RpoP